MSHRLENPWPAPTAPASPAPSSSSTEPEGRALKRRRIPLEEIEIRQDSSNGGDDEANLEGIDWNAINEAKETCRFSPYDVISCYPTTDTNFTQNSWVTFVWNSNLPQFTQTNRVNIYLYHADSQEEMFVFRDIWNPLYGQSGEFRTRINDTWWPNPWDGQATPYPFAFVIKRSDQELDGSETTQSVFNAIQTTYANSVLESMTASTTSTASTSQVTSSPTPTSLSGVVTTTDSDGDPITYTTNSNGDPTDSSGHTLSTDSNGVPLPTGSVQDNPGEGGFPNWAIAVIVVLGFLALVFAAMLAFFIGRRMKRRRELDSNRNSMGSSTPMMQNVDTTHSPLMSPTGGGPGAGSLAAAGAAGAAGGALASGYSQDRHSSLGHDGASTISGGDSGPFSGADAAVMADAFRRALRKPDFAQRPVEEGESPEHEDHSDPVSPAVASGVLSRELAEEGRDIRSVSSSRGVRVVEGSEDGASTIHHHD